MKEWGWPVFWAVFWAWVGWEVYRGFRHGKVLSFSALPASLFLYRQKAPILFWIVQTLNTGLFVVLTYIGAAVIWERASS